MFLESSIHRLQTCLNKNELYGSLPLFNEVPFGSWNEDNGIGFLETIYLGKFQTFL